MAQASVAEHNLFGTGRYGNTSTRTNSNHRWISTRRRGHADDGAVEPARERRDHVEAFRAATNVTDDERLLLHLQRGAERWPSTPAPAIEIDGNITNHRAELDFFYEDDALTFDGPRERADYRERPLPPAPATTMLRRGYRTARLRKSAMPAESAFC